MLKKTDKNSAKTNRSNILLRTLAIFLTAFLALPSLAWLVNTERVGFASSQQQNKLRNRADIKVRRPKPEALKI